MRSGILCLVSVMVLGCAAEQSTPPDPASPDTVAVDTMATANVTATTATTTGTTAPPPPVVATSTPPPVIAKSTPPPKKAAKKSRTKSRSAPMPAPPPRPEPAMAGPPPIDEIEMQDYVKVPVFYATTRKVAGDDPRNIFGADRAKTQYGVSWVSIPRIHEAGELESPSILTFTFREDPAKHIVLLDVQPKPKETWYADLNASIAAGQKQAFVFVHGYNVAFADASRRTAQIKYDLGFDGPAILFSWPSHGKESLYLADEANAGGASRTSPTSSSSCAAARATRRRST